MSGIMKNLYIKINVINKIYTKLDKTHCTSHYFQARHQPPVFDRGSVYETSRVERPVRHRSDERIPPNCQSGVERQQ